MKIIVDADACPRGIKEIIIRAALRRYISVVFIANKPINLPESKLLTSIQVSAGFDVADEKILNIISTADIAITADIPLADAIINKGAKAVNSRGLEYTAENIKNLLATRDLKEELRDLGIPSGGPRAFSDKDKHKFASTLDRLLSQIKTMHKP